MQPGSCTQPGQVQPCFRPEAVPCGAEQEKKNAGTALYLLFFIELAGSGTTGIKAELKAQSYRAA